MISEAIFVDPIKLDVWIQRHPQHKKISIAGVTLVVHEVIKSGFFGVQVLMTVVGSPGRAVNGIRVSASKVDCNKASKVCLEHLEEIVSALHDHNSMKSSL